MPNRRIILIAAAILAITSGAAQAQSWKAQYPELVFAVVPAENASGVSDRYAAFAAYLSKELGVPVKVRVANDYAAVIEGQRAGSIHIAYYGPASYSTAYMTGVKTEPFVTTRNNDGAIGYYSVIYVKSDGPYKDIHDLKGKTIGFVDPNSTSGYNAPRFFLNKAGIDADTFFSKSIVTGSHENAVIALKNGTVDCAANWWNADDDSNLTRMVTKGMAKKEDFRIIFKSGLLPGSPYARLSTLPDDLKAAIAKAFADAPTKDKAAFDRLSDGKDKEFVPVTHQDYAETVEMIQYVNDMRKKRS
ncbi:MAG: phosphonate ABC transporter substrate-binding protein [Bradyrhizobiaceae bacterium]|nr:phosphonate ABC transporter substrate-binding protein [Hyphomicrobiales bacterium]MBV9428723.1 phosphonate ABC transporter substrate-binding protein [Bradyrhizobiaceae bacterium]